MKKILYLLLLSLIIAVPCYGQKVNKIFESDSSISWTLGSKAKDTTVLLSEHIGLYSPSQINVQVYMPTAGVDSALYVYYYWGYFGTDWRALARVDTLVHAGTRKYFNANATAGATVYTQKWIPIDSLGPYLKVVAVGTADNGGDTASSLKVHTEIYCHSVEPWDYTQDQTVPIDYALAMGAHDTTVLFTKNIAELGYTKFSMGTYLYSGTANIDSLVRINYQHSNSGATGTWISLAGADTLWAVGVDSNTYGYMTLGSGLVRNWWAFDSLSGYIRALAIVQADSTGGDTGQIGIEYCTIGYDERCDPPTTAWEYTFDEMIGISYSFAADSVDTVTLFSVDMVDKGLMELAPQAYLMSSGAQCDSNIIVRYYRSANNVNWYALAETDTILEEATDTLRIAYHTKGWLEMDSTSRYFKMDCIYQGDHVGDTSHFFIRTTVKGLGEVCKQFK